MSYKVVITEFDKNGEETLILNATGDSYIICLRKDGHNDRLFSRYPNGQEADGYGILVWVNTILSTFMRHFTEPVSKGLAEGVVIHLSFHLGKYFKSGPAKPEDNGWSRN